MAAQVAQQMEAGCLVLTHISASCSSKDLAEMKRTAEEHYTGKVVMAEDFMYLDVHPLFPYSPILL
eukprot:CAMPEP_0174255428 /NCGR_PEP_ID=MMETSP0439-20130205/4767_1 /TAXON_ID=0 /ORGANISM="Stereomyxa ramosa, Strain Chinc5" /LENGTH=65 /DNA_ID=CAMNT_0015337615 /DNA_START=637 /DNA_END=834 /DNA_ORIENTATION=-